MHIYVTKINICFFFILIEKANAICNIGNLIFSNIISWQWEKQNIVLKRIWARGTTHSDESAFDLLLFMWNLVRVRDVRDLKCSLKLYWPRVKWLEEARRNVNKLRGISNHGVLFLIPPHYTVPIYTEPRVKHVYARIVFTVK